MSLEKIRREIDKLDEEIQAKLLERAALVRALRPYKQRLTDEKREEEILNKIHSPFVLSVYKALFNASKEILKEEGLS